MTRAILIIAGFLALSQLKTTREISVWEVGPNGQARAVHLSPPVSALSSGRYWIVSIFSRWDAEWYLGIARNGYKFDAERGKESNTAFFPLYPALMAVVGKLFGPRDVSILLAGILISNCALLVGLAGLAALVRLDFDEETAARAVLYLLVFPTAFFFSAVYTESVFFAAVTLAFYCGRRDRWVLAALAGTAATLTRPPGVLMFVVLAFEYLYQRSFRLREIRPEAAALLLIPVALFLHFAFLYWKFGSFWIFFQTEHAWGRPLVGSTNKVAAFGHFSAGDVFVTALSAVLIAVAWRRLRPSYGLYATLAFLMPLASGTLLGMARFCAVIFPLYIVLAMGGRKAEFDRLWLVLSSSLAVLFMALFCQWHYVG